MDGLDTLRDQNRHWADPDRRFGRAFGFRRPHLELCLGHITQDGPQRALALIGPRHVGKTVLLWQVADELLDRGVDPRRVVYCNLADERWLDPPSPRNIVALAESLNAGSSSSFILLDEIQVFDKWHAWLKTAVDEGRHRFLVTGSAASTLRQGARESGLGRWDEVPIEAFSFGEFSALRSHATSAIAEHEPNAFERYLRSSGFPAHAFDESSARVRHRLREDIADRAIVRDLQRLRIDVDQARRLFLFLTENSGGILNSQERAKDLSVNRKSLSKWLDVLLDTRLVVSLPATTTRQGSGPGKATRTLRGRPKIHAADHGIIYAFAPVPDPAMDPHFRGQMFEAIVFRHLREAQRAVRNDAQAYARLGDVQLSYWRDRSGEIDFVADTRGGRVAIEVTASAKGDREKLAKFRAAADRAGASRRVLICAGFGADRSGEIEILPIEEFVHRPLEVLEGVK